MYLSEKNAHFTCHQSRILPLHPLHKLTAGKKCCVTFPTVTPLDQQIFDRQQAMGDDGVRYVLARTMRSCIQYNAAKELGATGQGNQCKRGDCMAAAMSMFCGKKMEGLPRDVVKAMLMY